MGKLNVKKSIISPAVYVAVKFISLRNLAFQKQLSKTVVKKSRWGNSGQKVKIV